MTLGTISEFRSPASVVLGCPLGHQELPAPPPRYVAMCKRRHGNTFDDVAGGFWPPCAQINNGGYTEPPSGIPEKQGVVGGGCR